MTPATPARRTRREAQQATRDRLVAAALDMVAEGGVGALTIRGVSDRAGFSQGAFYSNFAGKDALLLALTQDYLSGIAAQLAAVVDDSAGLALDDSLRNLAARMTDMARSSRLSRLIIEMHLHAQRDAGFARAFDAIKSGYLDQLTRMASALISRHNLTAQIPPRDIAQTMAAMWTGALVQRVGDEDFAIADRMMLFFRAATTPADAPPA